MKSSISVRRSNAEDAAAVFRLMSTSVQNLTPKPYSKAVIDSWMHGVEVNSYHNVCSEGKIWIAEVGKAAVGFAQGIPGEIKYLFVDVTHAGRGIGHSLMEHAWRDARNGPQAKIEILALLNAVPFYEKWGFRGVERTTLPDRGEGLPSIEIFKMEKEL
ncbi:MAG: GNAT family N-acetyltransferase [Pseudomonadota bacterium]